MPMTNAEIQRRARKKQLEKGLCGYTGCQNKPKPGRKMCQQHLDHIAALSRDRRDACLAAGKCQHCRKRKLAKDRKFCRTCLKMLTARIKAAHAKDPDKRRLRIRALLAKGICSQCYKRPLRPGKSRCAECALRQAEQMRARRVQQASCSSR